MQEKYRRITVKDLVDAVKADPKAFPKGMNTAILSGDFEGNYTHEKHEVFIEDRYNNIGPALFLGYEMHEDYDEDDDDE